MSFADFGLCEPLATVVTAQGYTTPTPIQAQAIPVALAGRDVLGLAQTGTGKTAAFALPLLDRLSRGPQPPRGVKRRIRALILSPTRELATQIGDSLETYGRGLPLWFTVVVGGAGFQPQIRALRQGIDILVATPGRLEDLRQQGHVDLRGVEIFVLDEADRMLDIGFLPDIRRVVSLLPEERQTMLFSATMPEPIVELAETILREPARIEIAPVKATTELIEQSVCYVAKPQKSRLLASFLTSEPVSRAIVFTKTKHGADRVAEQLERIGIPAEAIHGNKSHGARQRALAQFRSSKPPVLVATDLAARGIDVDGVSHVLNYDLPIEPETYIHRIGRTGRAGASGIAVSFCDESERRMLKAIERLINRRLPVNPASPVAEPQSPLPRDREPAVQRPRRPQSGRAGATRHAASGPSNQQRRRRPKPVGAR